jgi:hypothetical protein
VASLALSVFFLVGAAVSLAVASYLDKILDSIEDDGAPNPNELDEVERLYIKRLFVPMAHDVDPDAVSPADSDVETIRLGYNFHIGSIETGRVHWLEFKRSTTWLFRGLCIVTIFLAIPGATGLASALEDQPSWYASITLVSLAGVVGGAVLGIFSLGLRIHHKRRYHDCTWSLRTILSNKVAQQSQRKESERHAS